MLEHKFIKIIIEPHKYCVIIHKIPDVITIFTIPADGILGFNAILPCFPCILTKAGPA